MKTLFNLAYKGEVERSPHPRDFMKYIILFQKWVFKSLYVWNRTLNELWLCGDDMMSAGLVPTAHCQSISSTHSWSHCLQ